MGKTMTEENQEAIEEVVTEPSTETEEQPTPEQEEAEAKEPEQTPEEGEEDKDPPEHDRRKNSAKERINQITRKYRDSEREVERLQKQVAKLTEGQEPREEDYSDNYEGYLADKSVHALRKSQADMLQEDLALQQEQIEQNRQMAYAERAQIFREQNPNFDQTIGSSPVQVSDDVKEAILDSDMGPQIAFHLAKNPHEAQQLSTLSPREQVLAIGRMEGRMTAPQPRRTTTAPTPVPQVQGKSVEVETDPNKMSMSDYIKWRKSGGGA